MLQFLYRIRPTRASMLIDGPDERESSIVAEHFAHLQRLSAQGTLIMAGRTLNNDESTFGIVVFRAESTSAANRIMSDDPAVAQGVMHAELFPYRVAVWSAADPLND
jgi:uncharacterized protein